MAELAVLCILFTLVIVAVLLEILRRVAGKPSTPKGQFRLRMVAGCSLFFLVGLLTFGVLFLRPEDGKVFGWYWTLCGVLLFGILILLREDSLRTRSEIRRAVITQRDETLAEIRRMIDDHGTGSNVDLR